MSFVQSYAFEVALSCPTPPLLYFECIQSRAVITRSNLSRYYTQHYYDSSRTWIRFETHKRHPYLALRGELMGVGCEDIIVNWPRYNGTVLCKAVKGIALQLQHNITIGIRMITSSLTGSSTYTHHHTNVSTECCVVWSTWLIQHTVIWSKYDVSVYVIS